MNWFTENKNQILLNIYVIPRSSRTEIVGIHDNHLKIKLKSPPVDNEANEELIRFISKKLNVPKSNIEIIKGNNQKRKTISIAGCEYKMIKGLIS